MKDLEEESKELPLYSLIASAFLTFLCNAPEDTRVEYTKKWCKELGLADFDLTKFLSTERDVLQLQLAGLPSDHLSHENAIIILQVRTATMSSRLLFPQGCGFLVFLITCNLRCLKEILW